MRRPLEINWSLWGFKKHVKSMVFGLRKLLQLTKRYPESVGGTVASIAIVTTHAQMISIVTSMDLSWPVEAKMAAQRVLHGFFLDLPGMVHVQCLISTVYTIQIVWGCLISL